MSLMFHALSTVAAASTTVSGMNKAGLGRHRNFRQLWIAETATQMGTATGQIALPFVAVVTLHSSTLQVGLLTSFEYLAFLLVSLPVGAWVDRIPRRPVLLVSDISRAVLLGSIPLAVHFKFVSIIYLYIIAFIVGIFTVFFDTAYQSYLPYLVEDHQLVEGNSKLEASRAIAQVSGPGIGGFLIQWLTAPIALLVDSVSFLGSAFFLGRISVREVRSEPKADRHLGREITEGLRFVSGNRPLRAIVSTSTLWNLFGTINTSLLLLLLSRDVGLSAGKIGLIFSGTGLGALLGALLANRVSGRLGQGPTVVWSTAVGTVAGLGIPEMQRDWRLWVGILALTVNLCALVVYNITQVSYRQQLCPPEMQGRMNSTIKCVVLGAMPLGALAGGTLGQAFGIRHALWIGSIGSLSAVLPVYFSPLRRLGRSPVVPVRPDTEFDVAGAKSE